MPLSWVDLPALPHPQYVSQNGFELAGPEVAREVPATAQEGEREYAQGDGNDAEINEGAAVGVQAEEESGEPLLSMSDRYVETHLVRAHRSDASVLYWYSH